MKKCILVVIVCFFCNTGETATVPAGPISLPSFSGPVDPLTAFSSLSIKQVQELIGRKLKLKEKIAVRFFQWKLKKGFTGLKEKKERDKGKTAMILGIAAVVSPVIPVIGAISLVVCSILALTMGYQALKEDPADRKAKTGVILGWIGVGIIVLVLVILVAILASFSAGWGWG